MAKQMTEPEWRAFLTHGTRTGKLATTRADGRPHVVPIWYVLDGDDLVFTTGAGSVKARSMRRDGRVSICVDDERPPYAFATIEGTVTISEDRDELLRFATDIGGRYMGADQAEAIGRRNAAVDELLVRITPTRVFAQTDVAGW